jgi:hypothetical protein
MAEELERIILQQINMPFQKGHIPFKTALGKKRPHKEETKIKMSKITKKVMESFDVRKRISDKLKGRKLSDLTRNKISDFRKGLPSPAKGKHWSLESKLRVRKIRNNKNPSENKLIRKSIEFRLWREAVYARDGWTCQKTGVKGGKLHPHHILNFSEYPDLRFAIDNGITLSEESHRNFHKKFGWKNNTREQLVDFLGKETWYGK